MLQETNTYMRGFRLFDVDYWPPDFKLKVLLPVSEWIDPMLGFMKREGF